MAVTKAEKLVFRLRAMLPARRVTYICEFLCEFAIICKNDLTHQSVTEVGLIDEKTEGRKSRETFPLTAYEEFFHL
jgi:hypothetical protein